MEFKGATHLYTLAGLMITFAGFSALLFGLRQAAGARLSLLDRYIAKTVMTYIFVLTAAALLPALFALYNIQEKWIWRGSGVLFALPMLSALKSALCGPCGPMQFGHLQKITSGFLAEVKGVGRT